MRIGLIGAGKVGTSLGKLFTEHGLDVVGYYSKSSRSAQEAATFTNTQSYDAMKQLVEASDVLFLTVPDREIVPVWNEVRKCDLVGKIITHCSGLYSSAVFSDIAKAGAFGYSIHPFLAISTKYDSWDKLSDCLFTVEGDDCRMHDVLQLLSVCTNKTMQIRAQDKALYHAAASVASNFMVTLADLSVQMLGQCGFDETQALDALSVLMRENISAVIEKGTRAALTGPIERNDVSTVQMHLEAVPDQVRDTYRLLARSTTDLAKRKHPDRSYERMEEVLR